MGQPVDLYDENGQPYNIENPLMTANERIKSIKRVDVASGATGTFDVALPPGAFNVVVHVCDAVDTYVLFNDDLDEIPLEQGSSFGPWVDLTSMKIKINNVGTVPVMLLFACSK